MSRGDEIFEWNTPRYTKRELHAAVAAARADERTKARRGALLEAKTAATIASVKLINGSDEIVHIDALKMSDAIYDAIDSLIQQDGSIEKQDG